MIERNKVYRKDDFDKLSEAFEASKAICVCGHSQSIAPYHEKGICSYCFRTIKNNTKARFRYLLFKRLNGGK